MTKQELVATLNVAYGVDGVDGFSEEEKEVLAKELLSYKLAEEDNQEIMQAYNEMALLDAVNIIAQASEEVRKEAHALIVYTCISDESSDAERGAYTLMKCLCGLPAVDYEEAKQILGF